jgi:hypothetical protein
MGIYDCIYALALIEYKTWDLQSRLKGHTDESSFDYNLVTPNGTTLHLGNFSGSIWSDAKSMYIANSYRGIENIFGNVWQFVDGVNINTDDNQHVYVCYDPTKFASNTTSDYIDTEYTPGWDGDNAYIKDIVGSGKYLGLYPAELGNGANSDSYITDYMYNDALGSGWRVLRVGGRLRNGRYAGFGYRASYNSSSNRYSAFGCRVCGYI